MRNEINVVIGSWGSYNERNERALGSKWLTLNDFASYEDIERELIDEGFQLDGIDEELFIQDIEGIDGFNCDYMTPSRLYNLLNESGVLDDADKYDKAVAYIEAFSFSDWERLVNEYGDYWDGDIYFYRNMTINEVMMDMIEECYSSELDKLGWLSNYITIDYEAIARESDGYHEVGNGVLEVR